MCQELQHLTRKKTDAQQKFDGAMKATRGLTQEEFCIKYGLSVASLRDWEQGRFSPDPTARAYLTIIDRAPEAVEEALTRAA